MSQILPNAVDAERAIVATTLAYGQRAITEAGDLAAELFYSRPFGALWNVLRGLGDSACDPQLVRAALRRADQLFLLRAHIADAMPDADADSEAAQVAFLGLFASEHGSFPNALPDHAKRIRSTAQRRALIEFADEVKDRAAKDGDGAEAIRAAEERLLAVASMAAPEARVKPWMELLRKALHNVEQRAEGREDRPPIRTGFSELDAVMRGGIRAGKQYVIAGRPAMGKSAFAMSLAVAAAQAGFPVLVFSCEMEGEELAERAIASEARVDLGWEAADRMNAQLFLRLNNAAAAQARAAIGVVDERGLTLTKMRAVARRWRLAQSPELRTRPAVLLVDYLQLVESEVKSRKGESREQEVSALSRGLRNLAGEINAASLCLSQLNRDLEKRPDKRPQLFDLRESGAIEQDADVVMMLYRDEVYNRDTSDKGICEVLIRKQRGGRLAKVKLLFIPEYTRFEALADDAQQDFLPPAPPAGYGDDYDR